MLTWPLVYHLMLHEERIISTGAVDQRKLLTALEWQGREEAEAPWVAGGTQDREEEAGRKSREKIP